MPVKYPISRQVTVARMHGKKIPDGTPYMGCGKEDQRNKISRPAKENLRRGHSTHSQRAAKEA